MLAPAWSEPLLQRMPEVRSAIPMPVGHGELGLGRRWRLGRALRSRHYDQALLLPNSLESALVPLIAGIPRRTGWRGELRYGLVNDLRLLDEQALPLMVQRFVALALDAGEALPVPLPAPRLARRRGPGPALPRAAGAGARSPPAGAVPRGGIWRRQALAGCQLRGARPALSRAGLAGGPVRFRQRSGGDRRGAGQYAEGHDFCFDLAGRTRLAEAVDLLSLATAVVSNDSGLMHIAAALARPLVVIYGATSPRFTPPLNANAAILASAIDCAPCFQRECPLGHHRCMRDTPVERVAGALDALLAGAEPQ